MAGHAASVDPQRAGPDDNFARDDRRHDNRGHRHEAPSSEPRVPAALLAEAAHGGRVEEQAERTRDAAGVGVRVIGLLSPGSR